MTPDMLLVFGLLFVAISLLSQESRDFVVVGQPAEMALVRPGARRAPVALAITLGMLGLMAFNLVPNVVAVLLAAVGMVLTAPVAFQAAVTLGIAPQAFLMTVAVAASTAFATPIATSSNTLVLGSGGYRFGDFLRVGLLLQLAIMGGVLLLLPLVFPF